MTRGTATSQSTPAAATHFLPEQPDDLLGQDAEELKTAEAALMETGYRLLTLLGPGGMGRAPFLALGIGSSLAGEFAEGARFVDLTRIRDASAVAAHMTRELDIKVSGSAPLESLKHWLAGVGEILIILDNFEHVVAASSSVAQILEACPNTRFVVTSREPLRLTWEQRLVVPPLALPDLMKLPTADEVAATPAVALFMRHARAINPGFGNDSRDLQRVAELCVRLEGVPLAIELAATRANVLSPASILQRLDDPQRFLRASIRNAPERHRSIEATLDWSFDLLGDTERVAFRRLGAFAGGFTFEAADAVLDAETGDTLEVLSSLADKALLVAGRPADGASATRSGDPCGRMRTNGSSRPANEPQSKLATRATTETGLPPRQRGIASWLYALFGSATHFGPFAPGSPAWVDRIALDRANIDRAFQYFASHDESNSVLRMAAALQVFWWRQDQIDESLVSLQDALDKAQEAPPELRADALHGLGMLLRRHDSLPEARAILEQSVLFAKAAQRNDLLCRSLVELGLVGLGLGRLEEARSAITEAHALWSSRGDRWGIAATEGYLSLVETMQGHLNRAEALGRHAAAVLSDLGDARSSMLAAVATAFALILGKKHTQANDLLFECLDTARMLQEPQPIGAFLEVVARSLLDKGDAREALTLLGVCQAAESHGSARVWAQSPLYSDALLGARSGLSESEVSQFLKRGAETGLAQALDIAERALLAESVPTPTLPPRPAVTRGPLSPREREVLELVSLGRSNREIAQTMYVSESTVKFHVTSILNKLGANTRTEAVSSAMRRGILSIEEPDDARG